MGTRGAYGIKSNGKYYVTYNHFDSYPDGLGDVIVEFCRKIQKENGWDAFRKGTEALTLVNLSGIPSAKLIEKYRKYSDINVSRQTVDDWYCLLRNLQFGEILTGIYNGNIEHMINGFDFLSDSLFCEYAYIINLDKMRLEFYEGFNDKGFDENSPLPFIQKEVEIKLKEEEKERKRSEGTKYYPVRFKGSVPLSKIPKKWKEKFYPEEKEEVSNVAGPGIIP